MVATSQHIITEGISSSESSFFGMPSAENPLLSDAIFFTDSTEDKALLNEIPDKLQDALTDELSSRENIPKGRFEVALAFSVNPEPTLVENVRQALVVSLLTWKNLFGDTEFLESANSDVIWTGVSKNGSRNYTVGITESSESFGDQVLRACKVWWLRSESTQQ